MTVPQTPGDHEIALARGAAYGLVSHGFQYPARDVVNTLADPARWSEWPEILHRVAPETEEHLVAVRALLHSESSRLGGDPAAEPSDLQETFNGLFGHAVRGKCPPYELEYGRSEIIQQASFLADVAGFYAAFGMEVNHDADERADHIAVESEFMAVLCAKEAHAFREGHAEHLDVSIKAQRDFLKDHLAHWLPAFTHRVAKADPRGFYGVLAGFASALVAAECRRFEITAGGHTVELRPADPVLDTSMGCGPTAVGSSDAGEQLIQLSTGEERDRDR